MRHLFFSLAIFFLVANVAAAQQPKTLDVWPGKPPGETTETAPEKVTVNKRKDGEIKIVTNVTQPTITVYRPAKDKDTGTAVLICPGGGYNVLAMDLEGEEVAAWLNSIGVTGIVLKYRVPRRKDDPKDGGPIGALQDAQRAMSLVRFKATDLKIDPKRIGMLGFSAGGHLTASLSTNFDKRRYDAIDDVDKASCRPDFAVLIYPGGVIEKGKATLRTDIKVTKDTPPMFFAHASNDPVSSENSVALYLALREAKVPAEMHLYATGGHGFGLRKSDLPCSTWPARCEEWMRKSGYLAAGK